MKKLFFIIFLTFITFNAFSQDLDHEIGVSLGAVSFQSDYGERGDFGSSYGNIGFGASLSYYISYDMYRRLWNDKTAFLKEHFRLKLDASYMNVNFIHRGKYIENNDITAVKMAAMRGNTKIYNFGGQIEYSIFSSMEEKDFEPYISMGMYYVLYDPDLTSELGDWRDNPSYIPTVYQNGSIHLQKDKTQSVTFGAGTRYRLNNFTMVFDFRWQKFLTNNVDGLDPQLGANKHRDWLLFAQVGAVFKLH